ncbi:hypothetical protein F4V89_23605 [Neorhizobium galegae]|nr:hypothetical protein F4V88_00645 [Neorhizobium galegae]KAB1110588.1 hypothetical protein F4V89_23605 [Neorhizobium galegae]
MVKLRQPMLTAPERFTSDGPRRADFLAGLSWLYLPYLVRTNGEDMDVCDSSAIRSAFGLNLNSVFERGRSDLNRLIKH